jgi:hypothetical protein
MIPQDATPAPVAPPLKGRLSIFVAFDWGDEIDLDLARRFAPDASRALALSRRSRTPPSIAFKPSPLRFRLGAVAMPLPGLPETTYAEAVATVFDFGAVSVALTVPFELTPEALVTLAGRLADPGTAGPIVQEVRVAAWPLFEKLQPALKKAAWNEDLWEEYFVFQFPAGAGLRPEDLLDRKATWPAALVRLEDQPLCAEEMAEARRQHLRYGLNDLFIPDWAAAVLLDDDQGIAETLEAVEFANLQLLEYRHIDDRLDQLMARAQDLLQAGTQRTWPLWRGPYLAVRHLGGLRVEAAALFERTGNVLKLIGDQYLARVYRSLAGRFHIREWEQNIQRKLEAVEGAYEVLSDQTAAFRMEFLEVIVIVLIAVEVILAFVRPHLH